MSYVEWQELKHIYINEYPDEAKKAQFLKYTTRAQGFQLCDRETSRWSHVGHLMKSHTKIELHGQTWIPKERSKTAEYTLRSHQPTFCVGNVLQTTTFERILDF